MDSDSESSGGLLHKLSRLFNSRSAEQVEQAIIEADADEILPEERSMLLRVLHLDDVQVQDIMTPRTDIYGVEANTALGKTIELVVESGHSRIPIYKENRDNIVGVVYAKDLLRELLYKRDELTPVASLMRAPFFVPATKNALELLQEFRAKKTHLAIILDEYGGTSGVVTIEDVLEQIVGEIEDEHDAPREEEIQTQPDGSALISGRAYLEDLNSALGLKLESEEVDTIGGHLSHILGRMPQTDEELVIDGRAFKILHADAKQIHRILLAPASDK